MDDAGPSDAQLVAAATRGDAAALGLLLQRHRASMLAVAVALLGFGPGAEDAVQDAALIALRRLDDLRSSDAVGAWLRTIVRNVCRMQLRRAGPSSSAWPQADSVVSAESPEEVLDRHALRDWIWHAIGRLSEPLQAVLLLRHFGRQHSYAEIANICDIPIGTVRSRLNQARRELATWLIAEADARYDNERDLSRQRSDQLRELLRSSVDGDLTGMVADLAEPDMVFAGWWGTVGPAGMDLTEEGRTVARWSDAVPDGRDLLVHVLSADAEAGVRERVVEVASSRGVTVMECELISPPWDPTHCPPAVLWLVKTRDERISGIRLYHPSSV
jgi:RNA polymerase sigma factor (sigma-70 family)